MSARTHTHTMLSGLVTFVPPLLSASNGSIPTSAPGSLLLILSGLPQACLPTVPQTHPPWPPPCFHMFCPISTFVYLTHRNRLSVEASQPLCLALLAPTDSLMDFEFLEIGTGFCTSLYFWLLAKYLPST